MTVSPANRFSLGRRSLFTGMAATLLLAGCGAPEETGTQSTAGTKLQKIPYGDEHPDQFGMLGLPDGTPQGLAILLHGGFWLDQYQAGLMDPIAADLRKRGFATWNVEYRRVGTGGGYPRTFEDVAAAMDKVPELPVPVRIATFSLGHSAGGQLAVWAASRTADTPGGGPAFIPDSTISLSGILDLTEGAAEGIGNGAVVGLMDGTPAEKEAAYALADPTLLAPASKYVAAMYAEDDEIVPTTQSTTYARIAQAAGGAGDPVPVPGGHFDLIDPDSDAWAAILKQIPEVSYPTS